MGCGSSLNKNSLKFYDKGSVLRVEATINEPREFRSFRAAEQEPRSPKQWRILRRSVATLCRAQVSRAATERHLTALASSLYKPRKEQAARDVSACEAPGQRLRALNRWGQRRSMMAIVNAGNFRSMAFVTAIFGSIFTRPVRMAKERQQMRRWDGA